MTAIDGMGYAQLLLEAFPCIEGVKTVCGSRRPPGSKRPTEARPILEARFRKSHPRGGRRFPGTNREGLKATLVTQWVCPRRENSSRPLDASHTFTVLSYIVAEFGLPFVDNIIYKNS